MHDPESIITSLANAPAIIVPLVRDVPERFVRVRPYAGKWSAHEHACHLAEVHPLFFSRLEQMLSEPQARIRPYDPQRDMTSHDALLEVDLDQALARFILDRNRLVEKLRRLSPDDWERTALHSEYAHYSIFGMFRHLALHDLLHAYRIEELLLKRDWEEAKVDNG
ncbi:MAG: DinB family protein [Pyrinomonadaceae bacterium]